ncbi:MAG TPA: Uma2 family endonuclease [Oscillatoriaceae cyanobacterium M33_DOE_052]|uniref:Uma2 family endonuclease n=1 Tax=Planktothricoides sp. SpSt-374 TaxID=2282167 RepID=A0A7C3ZU41_9CYAN|nr:Uma2 family endonuclease [Oscillatoriaceae cyanobacterium M33_DOE_052]
MQLTTEAIIYPSSDGQPMADSTIQYQWITTIKGGCDAIFKDDENVFVAGDLLWYPVEGKPNISQAPDVMVAFGTRKGDRKSYKQWLENNIPPQVVFEVRSDSDTQTKMDKKLVFYNRYGVEEYYLYDPQRKELSGWRRIDGMLDVIDPMPGWVSPRLGVRFELGDEGLELYAPNGEKFVDYVDLYQQKELERQQKELAEQQLELERQQLELERQRSERLAAQLRSAGIDPEI